MKATAHRWRRLRAHLDAHGATEVGNAAGRVGAVLALLAERDDGDLELILTRRRDDLPTHPGQVSFPGGRREPGESTTAAALREAHEEIGLRTVSVEVLGHLPAFFIPPSRYWLAPVVARWLEPHPLCPQETEVAALMHAPLAHLLDPRRWRKVRLSMTGWSLAWQLDGDHVLWGATAMVTAVLLDALEPGWRRGNEPASLSDELEITPWLDQGLRGRVQPPRLTDVDTRERGGIPAPSGPADPGAPAEAGAAIVTAIERLRDRPERIVVLAGSGHNGAAGVAAATLLRRRGARVAVVAADGARLAHVGGGARTFDGTLPAADLYVDALVGGGLRGRLRGTPLDMLLALRAHDAPILAVDLPTGLHPTEGLIGDTLSATVTVALKGMWPVMAHAGLAPFIGDLYLWEGPGPDIVRLVAGPERAALHGGWRE